MYIIIAYTYFSKADKNHLFQVQGDGFLERENHHGKACENVSKHY